MTKRARMIKNAKRNVSFAEFTKINSKTCMSRLNKFSGKKFSEHIILEHNIFDYLNFIIYIEEKLQVNCNGVEKFVKDKLKKKEIDFLPIGRAISLKSIE